jgi:hypothetical protein
MMTTEAAIVVVVPQTPEKEIDSDHEDHHNLVQSILLLPPPITISTTAPAAVSLLETVEIKSDVSSLRQQELQQLDEARRRKQCQTLMIVLAIVVFIGLITLAINLLFLSSSSD